MKALTFLFILISMYHFVISTVNLLLQWSSEQNKVTRDEITGDYWSPIYSFSYVFNLASDSKRHDRNIWAMHESYKMHGTQKRIWIILEIVTIHGLIFLYFPVYLFVFLGVEAAFRTKLRALEPAMVWSSPSLYVELFQHYFGIYFRSYVY